MESMPSIPNFLKRQPTKESDMTKQETPKKVRKVTVLPSDLADGVQIAALTLSELVQYQASLKKELADMPRIVLELKAINVAIRKLAK